MTYAIGDVARTLGLTPGALHYFEREGVISSKKGGGARRTYGAEDIIRLISYRKYRSMEMPLKEIARQFSPEGDDCQTIAGKMRHQQLEAQKAAQRFEQLAGDIAWFAGHTALAAGRIGSIDVDCLPECYVLRVGSEGFISRSRSEQAHVAHWLEHMPAVRITSAREPDGRACLCYSVDAARAEQLGLHNTPGAVLLRRQAALHTFVRIGVSYYDQPQLAFAPLLDYARAHAFEQSSTALSISLCVECRGSCRDTIAEVWLPIG